MSIENSNSDSLVYEVAEYLKLEGTERAEEKFKSLLDDYNAVSYPESERVRIFHQDKSIVVRYPEDYSLEELNSERSDGVESVDEEDNELPNLKGIDSVESYYSKFSEYMDWLDKYLSEEDTIKRVEMVEEYEEEFGNLTWESDNVFKMNPAFSTFEVPFTPLKNIAEAYNSAEDDRDKVKLREFADHYSIDIPAFNKDIYVQEQDIFFINDNEKSEKGFQEVEAVEEAISLHEVWDNYKEIRDSPLATIDGVNDVFDSIIQNFYAGDVDEFRVLHDPYNQQAILISDQRPAEPIVADEKTVRRFLENKVDSVEDFLRDPNQGVKEVKKVFSDSIQDDEV